MLSEHVTAQETVLSRLSRSGMPLHLRELQQWVPEGKGWQASEVTNLRNQAEHDGSDDAEPTGLEDTVLSSNAHATLPVQGKSTPAVIVRPAALVNAWLAQAHATGLLTTRYSSHVAAVIPAIASGAGPETEWLVLNQTGHTLATGSTVVVAAAYGSAELLEPHGMPTDASGVLRPVKGQLSYGHLNSEPLAPHPVRDHGVYVPCFSDPMHPDATATSCSFWAMGSTYERGQNNTQVTTQAHDRNAASLATMLPVARDVLVGQQNSGTLLGWAQVRCASTDRLPLVGPMPAPLPVSPSMKLADVSRQPGLWALCAMGSRGLTLAMLGAELLVAKLEGEPLPIEKELADALDPARFVLKHARKHKKSP